MPKIFLIKNRLHQQQLKLQESQNYLANKEDLVFGRSNNDSHVGDDDNIGDGDGHNQPLSLVSRNRYRDNTDNTDSGNCNKDNTNIDIRKAIVSQHFEEMLQTRREKKKIVQFEVFCFACATEIENYLVGKTIQF